MGPILSYLFSLFMGQKKEENIDLDVLIRKQKLLMTKGKGSVRKESEEDNGKKITSKTITQYTEAFTKDSSNNELKTIIKIFDELQWGDGKFLTEQLKFLSSKYKIDQSPSSLGRCLSDLVKREYFLSLHNKELASLMEITKALRLRSLFETLSHQCQLRRGATVELLAKKYHFSPLTIMLAFELMMLVNSGKTKDQAYNAVMSASAKDTSLLPEKSEKLFTKILFKEGRKGFNSTEDFTDLIALECKAIEFILPLPSVKSDKDLQVALKIFKANPSTPIDEIKKRYKKMAVNKHPDKISSYGIPKKYENKATENFSRLKAAYDIILKSHKQKD